MDRLEGALVQDREALDLEQEEEDQRYRDQVEPTRVMEASDPERARASGQGGQGGEGLLGRDQEVSDQEEELAEVRALLGFSQGKELENTLLEVVKEDQLGVMDQAAEVSTQGWVEQAPMQEALEQHLVELVLDQEVQEVLDQEGLDQEVQEGLDQEVQEGLDQEVQEGLDQEVQEVLDQEGLDQEVQEVLDQEELDQEVQEVLDQEELDQEVQEVLDQEELDQVELDQEELDQEVSGAVVFSLEWSQDPDLHLRLGKECWARGALDWGPELVVEGSAASRSLECSGVILLSPPNQLLVGPVVGPDLEPGLDLVEPEQDMDPGVEPGLVLLALELALDQEVEGQAMDLVEGLELDQVGPDQFLVGLGMDQVEPDQFLVGLGMDQVGPDQFLVGLELDQVEPDQFLVGLGMDQVGPGMDQVELVLDQVEWDLKVEEQGQQPEVIMT
ncbi:unnamed protein product [Boreogadus saida]